MTARAPPSRSSWNKSMKISIKSEEKSLNLRFPSFLIFNAAIATLGSRFINSYMKKHSKDIQINIPPKGARRLFKEIRKARRRFKDWYIVDIVDKDGESVKIKL